MSRLVLNKATLGIGSAWKRNSASYRAVRERNVALLQARNFQPLQSFRRVIAAPHLNIAVFDDLTSALAEWRAFETAAPSTLYQTSLWCQAWTETVGSARGVVPRIVIGRDEARGISFILPLQTRRRQGVRVLEWLGAPHNTYGYGLFSPHFLADAEAWFAANWTRVLTFLGDFDAILLAEMPESMFGKPNPLKPIFNMLGANPSFTISLKRDFAEIHTRKCSSENRRTYRKKENGLAKAGQVTFGLPVTKLELHGLIDTMFSQQERRLAELGIHHVFGEPEHRFLHRLAELQDERNPILAPYHLSCNGEVLSVKLGGLHANGYWALISSLADHPHRKFSPGDIALRRTIASCCEKGLAFFDFSSGEAAYKRQWADDVIELHAAIGARTFRGLAWAVTMFAGLTFKRMVKRTPALLAVSTALRRFALGR
jgi:CelD/BcsL family acetyltransferase involved in cellulose biosynthesis